MWSTFMTDKKFIEKSIKYELVLSIHATYLVPRKSATENSATENCATDIVGLNRKFLN